MTNKPYLTLNEQKKVFTFVAGDNEFLQYLSEDDALFVSFAINENISCCFEKKNSVDKETIEKIVFIGEQYALELLKKGVNFRSNADQYLISYLKKLDLPTDKSFISKFDFQFKGINLIINNELALSNNFKNGRVDSLMKKYHASLKIKKEKLNILAHAYIIEFLFRMYMLRIELKPKFSIKFHRKVLTPNGGFFKITKF